MSKAVAVAGSSKIATTSEIVAASLAAPAQSELMMVPVNTPSLASVAHAAKGADKARSHFNSLVPHPERQPLTGTEANAAGATNAQRHGASVQAETRARDAEPTLDTIGPAAAAAGEAAPSVQGPALDPYDPRFIQEQMRLRMEQTMRQKMAHQKKEREAVRAALRADAEKLAAKSAQEEAAKAEEARCINAKILGGQFQLRRRNHMQM